MDQEKIQDLQRENSRLRNELKFLESRLDVTGSEVSLSTFIETMPQIAFMADADGHLSHYNRRHYEYTGVPKEHVEGWEWKNTPVIHPEDLDQTIKNWQRALESGEPYQNEYRLRRFDGEYRWHLARALPMRDPGGKLLGWVGTNTDIHEQKVLEHQLREEKLLREKFVTTLSHDLRTPLTAAKMNAELVDRKAENTEEVRRLVSRVISSIDRSERMVRDLLDANNLNFGNGIPIKLGHCQLENVITKALREFEAPLAKVCTFQNEDSGTEGFWDCDALQRVVENLASNALKYGSPGSTITIRLRREGPGAVISVHNEGTPIPLEEQEHLFDYYKRSGSAIQSGQKGWGIGLTLVRGIAEAHQGSVRVESQEGSGTTFSVWLPLDLKPSPASP